jgi:hypothetical protein
MWKIEKNAYYDKNQDPNFRSKLENLKWIAADKIKSSDNHNAVRVILCLYQSMHEMTNGIMLCICSLSRERESKEEPVAVWV